MRIDWTDSFTEPPFTFPDLGESEIHLWAIGLTSEPDSLHELLSPDELTTARRLRQAEHRRRYVVARGSIRQILAEYEGTSPSRLAFKYGDRGKPRLTGPKPVEFNLTHSGDVALLAVTRIGPIGIDVEKKRPIEDLLGLARRNFAPGEFRTLAGATESERLDIFFHCWTRKEAYVKAMGDGLAQPLEDFEVTSAPADAARLLSLGGSQTEAREWFLRRLQPAPGYVGALALQGRPSSITSWIWRHLRSPVS